MTALRTRLGLEALSGERRALVEARLDDLYESRGGDRAWAEAAEGERPALVEAFEAAARGVVADPETFRRRRLSYATAPAGAPLVLSPSLEFVDPAMTAWRWWLAAASAESGGGDDSL